MASEEIFVTGVPGFMKKLVSAAAKRIAEDAAVATDLQKLMNKLELIAAATSDAEKKQVKDKTVLLWLRRLQEVVYDVDDVLDEIAYEAMCPSQVYGNSDKVTVPSKFGFSSEIAKRIKIINQELDGIAKHSAMFQLERSVEIDQISEQLDQLAISHEGDFKIVGREKDTSRIVAMLLMTNPSLSSSDHFSPQVISIVGMGGLGKTTLAQLVYKDHSIQRSFEPRAWVCISDKFDIFLILKKILESITQEKCDECNVRVLVTKVHEKIRGKKYLLVLDDLWNENAKDWEKLNSCLSGGAQGSKILITTRKGNVASIVSGPISPYNLTTLSNEECWCIIKNKAFSPGGALETPDMSNIGMEIARKCAGLPLAAISLGGLMHLKSNQSDWLAFRDREIFNTPENPNGVIQILKTSYDDLPSHLKECFSYCCLFPKDWKFNRETLIQLWMAEGFLHLPSGRNENSLEDVGNYYFLSLLSGSFFHDVEKDDLGEIETFKMHDLVHDLAVSVTGSHAFTTLNTGDMQNDVSQIRRLQLIVEEKEDDYDYEEEAYNEYEEEEEEEEEEEVYSDFLRNAKQLQTIFWQDEGYYYPSLLSNKRLRVIHRLGGYNLKTVSSPFEFKHLRYLDLSYTIIEDVHAASVSHLYNLQTLKFNHGQNIQDILNGIGSLKNLQHLDLSYSDAKLLPDSMAALTNLKTLDINCCHNLTVLPTDIGSLQNLLRLDLEGTAVEVLPKSCITKLYNLEIVRLGSKCKLPTEVTYWRKLKRFTHSRDEDEMPRGVEELTQIQELRSYLVGKGDDSRFTSNSSRIEELASLNFLQLLVMRNLENVRGQIDAESACLKDKKCIRLLHLSWSSCHSNVEDSMVLEGLQPHPNLKELKIQRFEGSKLPRWMGLSYCLPNLVELCLFECGRCDKLPGLGMLPCLSVLRIQGMNYVKCLGKEFYYQEEGESSSSSSSTYLFPSLIELNVDGMESLVEWVPSPPPPYYSFPSLESLSIKKCRRLRTTPTSFPCLRTLKLEDINNKAVKSIVTSIEGLTSLISISYPGYQSNFTR